VLDLPEEVIVLTGGAIGSLELYSISLRKRSLLRTLSLRHMALLCLRCCAVGHNCYRDLPTCKFSCMQIKRYFLSFFMEVL